MFGDLGDRAAFFVVYIAEAHTTDGWQTASNDAEGIRHRQPVTIAERRSLARLCAGQLELTIPMLVDEMDNAAFEAFSAWPERIYIADGAGRIHYRGGHGPWDFDPGEARASLIALIEPSP